jgi:hypothetical protein
MPPADNLFPLEAGKELFIDEADAEPNEKMQFRFDVVLYEFGRVAATSRGAIEEDAVARRSEGRVAPTALLPATSLN